VPFPDPRFEAKTRENLWVDLGFFDRDRFFFAYFDTALTAQALFGIRGHGLAVFHLEYLSGTYIDTLFTTDTFFFINDRVKRH
jgi:hypothetical protein